MCLAACTRARRAKLIQVLWNFIFCTQQAFAQSGGMARYIVLWAGWVCLVAACCAPLAAADRWANPPLTPTCDKQMDGILDQFYGDNSTLAGCDDECRKQCNEVLHFTFTIMDKQRCFTEDRIRECLVVRSRSCGCAVQCCTGYCSAYPCFPDVLCTMSSASDRS